MNKFITKKTVFITLATLILVYFLTNLIPFPIGKPLPNTENPVYLNAYFTIYSVESGSCGPLGCGKFRWYKRVQGASPLSFELVNSTGLAKDNYHVFCGQRLDSVDRKTFNHVSGNYYKDNDEVRDGCIKIMKKQNAKSKAENFDPATFEVVGCGLVKDKSGVYSSGYDTYFGYESETNQFEKYKTGINIYGPVGYMDKTSIKATSHEADNQPNCIVQDTHFNYSVNKRYSPALIKITSTNDNTSLEDLDCYLYRINNQAYDNSRAISDEKFNQLKASKSQGTLNCFNKY